MVVRYAVLSVAALILSACASGSSNPVLSRDAENARAAATKVRAEWKSELARGARSDPTQVFPNLPRQHFLRRLRAASARHDFQIVQVEFLRPKQLAPRVVVESNDVVRLARAYPRFWRSIDPKAKTADDRVGWAWEGFLFEARDASGVPAFSVFHWWRARTSVGGGQWARTELLYPFPHL